MVTTGASDWKSMAIFWGSAGSTRTATTSTALGELRDLVLEDALAGLRDIGLLAVEEHLHRDLADAVLVDAHADRRPRQLQADDDTPAQPALLEQFAVYATRHRLDLLEESHRVLLTACVGTRSAPVLGS